MQIHHKMLEDVDGCIDASGTCQTLAHEEQGLKTYVYLSFSDGIHTAVRQTAQSGELLTCHVDAIHRLDDFFPQPPHGIRPVEASEKFLFHCYCIISHL